MKAQPLLWAGRIWVGAAYAFWALLALATPVTVFDANTYNLARLPLAMGHGLFGNETWNTFRQVCLPWTFDAVHLPFLALGGGTSLPSFASFTGILVITYRLVRARVGAVAATWSCGALLALPTLLYQATSCKNDIPVVFALFAWYFAWDCFRSQPRRVYLSLMALSLAFGAGAKTSGIPLALILAICSGWLLRGSWGNLLHFYAALVASFAAWGSVEIYVNNLRLYRNLLGPADYISSLRNHDGVKGAAANFIRYMCGFLDIGLGSSTLSAVDRWITGHLGCANAGLTPHQAEADVRIANDGWEASSSFGPLGAVAIWFAIIAPFLTKNKLIRSLGVASVASLGLVCLTTDWMPWNNRFLMLPMSLAAIGLAVATFAHPSPWRSAVFLGLVVISGVVMPCNSYNKSPRSLWAAVFDRQAYAYRERLTMDPLMRDLRRREKTEGLHDLVLCAGSDSWVLPFFTLNALRVEAAPNMGQVKWHEGEYVLFLNRDPDRALLANLELVQDYAEPDSALYRYRAAGIPRVLPPRNRGGA